MTTEHQQHMTDIELDLIIDSPFQPRTEYRGINDLAASIVENGILQSLLVRPVGSKYELVAGHRRKRGAQVAGLTKVPCIVREMSDDEAREAILVENGQREDLSALEELEVYASLRNNGMEVAEIAARIGRPEGHVYRRLQLVRLEAEGIAALRADQMTVAVAEMIARLTPATQKRAIQQLAGSEYTRPATAAHAKEWIEKQGTLVIGDADFDPEDATLTAAGVCSACPKNSAGTMLFSDLETAQCFDPDCWKDKREAGWERRATAAAEAGATVLDGEAAQEPFNQYGQLKPSWVNLDEKIYVNGKNKTVGAQIGKKRLEGVQRYLVRTRTGEALEIVKKADVKKVVAEAPKENDPIALTGAKPEQATKEERKGKIAKRFRELLLVRMGQALEKDRLAGGREFWSMFAYGMITRSWAAALSAAESRRKIAIKPNEAHPHPERDATDWLVSWVKGDRDAKRPHAEDPKPYYKASIADLQLFVFELMIAPELGGNWGDVGFNDGSLLLESMFGGKGPGFFTVSQIGPLANIWAEAEALVDAPKPEKKAKKTKANGETKAEDDPEPTPDGGPASTVEATAEMVAQAKDETAKVLALHAAGKSYREIAAELGLSKDAVARKIKKATEKSADGSVEI